MTNARHLRSISARDAAPQHLCLECRTAHAPSAAVAPEVSQCSGGQRSSEAEAVPQAHRAGRRGRARGGRAELEPLGHWAPPRPRDAVAVAGRARRDGSDAVGRRRGETVVEVVSEVGAEAAAAVRTHSTRMSRVFTPRRIRRLSFAALFAAAWECQDLRRADITAWFCWRHTTWSTRGPASTRLARFLGSRWLKLTMALVALGFAVVELVEDLPGAHHGVAVLAFANCVTGFAELTAAREDVLPV